jgi:hypothetical protein
MGLNFHLCFSSILILGVLGSSSCNKITYVKRTPGEKTSDEKIKPIKLSTFQAASIVLGQTTFTEANYFSDGPPRATDSASLENPWGNPSVYLGKLYVPGYTDNRILIFNSIPTTNNAAANIVLGQPDFASTSSGTDANQMSVPQDIVISGGKMFVFEQNNARILIWNTIPATNQKPADVVVGWPDFNTPSYGCAANLLGQYGEGMFSVSKGKMVVSDAPNNRVLIWNSIPTANGASADVVLGQPDFTTCGGNAATASTLYYPAGIWTDAARIVLADANNNRILIWNSFPTSNQAAADIVLGQPDMTSDTSGLSDSNLNSPYPLISNGTQIFVSDCSNNRILIWDSFPTDSNTPADKVLGQSDFLHNSEYDDNQDGTRDALPSARTLACAGGMYVDSDRLIVMDPNQRRALIYKGQ